MKEEIIQYERTISKVGKYSWMLVIDKKRLQTLGYMPGDTIEKVVLTVSRKRNIDKLQTIPPRVITGDKKIIKAWKKLIQKNE